MNDIRVMFFGTPVFAVSLLQALIDEKYNVVAVVSQPDRPVGRKHILQPTPVHAKANEYGIPCLQPEKLSQGVEEILSYKPDLIVTCAYGQFVPSTILNAPKYGCVNIHPSLLPKYRGGAPIQHAVMNGDAVTGVSLMEMAKGMDSGRVWAQVEVPVGSDMTSSELSDVLNEVSVNLLKDNLPKYINGELEGVEQDESKVTIGNNILKEEEYVSFQNEPLDQLYNHIRGLIDYPMPYGVLEGKRVKFCKVRKEDKIVSEPVGTVLGFEGDAMLVACNGGVLKVYELQMEGKKRTDAVTFKNGYEKLVVGKVFD